MNESRRTFLSILGVYAAGSWLVLQVVDVLNQNLGLPPWAFSLALTLLLIGLPIVTITALLHVSRRDTEAPAGDGLTGRSGFRGLFTWRNAILGGLGAMALWGVVATAWLARTRDADPAERSVLPPGDGSSGYLAVRTSPPEARVRLQVVTVDPGLELGAPVEIGVSPLEPFAVPVGQHVLRLDRDGWSSLTLLATVTEADTTLVEGELLPDSPVSDGMALIPAGPSPAGIGGRPVDAFLIDSHEVTNEAYAEFMADGGYGTANLWPDTLMIGGSPVRHADAMAALADRTGAAGPRSWSGSVFPAGSAQHPVRGVSWYEARAYCLWAGKRLPTLEQWWRAALGAGDDPFPWGTDAGSLRARANFDAGGTWEVGSNPLGVSRFGVFDLAGNVREWIRTEHRAAGSAQSVGGSWQDPEYTFSVEWREELPLGFANETTGFRCARHAD